MTSSVARFPNRQVARPPAYLDALFSMNEHLASIGRRLHQEPAALAAFRELGDVLAEAGRQATAAEHHSEAYRLVQAAGIMGRVLNGEKVLG